MILDYVETKVISHHHLPMAMMESLSFNDGELELHSWRDSLNT